MDSDPVMVFGIIIGTRFTLLKSSIFRKGKTHALLFSDYLSVFFNAVFPSGVCDHSHRDQCVALEEVFLFFLPLK